MIKFIFRPWYQVIEIRREVNLGISIRHGLAGCDSKCDSLKKEEHPWYFGIWVCVMLFEIGMEFHFGNPEA